MAILLDGKKLASQMQAAMREEIAELQKTGVTPGLAVVLVGADPASQVYVKNKRIACQKVGIKSFDYDLPATTSEAELLKLIDTLNHDKNVHGILVQLPLPAQISEDKVLLAVSAEKDVDCFHPFNIGRLCIGHKDGFQPCTPAGVMELIFSAGLELKGKHVVVIGRSNIVGKPAALMAIRRHATVTVCHRHTQNLEQYVKQADVLITAVGKAEFIRGEQLKPGVVVIDVGINRLPDGKLVGDVHFASAEKIAHAITPVPGGVGPMTITMLLKNVITAAKGLSHGATNSAVF